MAIEFLCSQCQCELQVGENAVGKKARCPRCGMIHDVPNQAGSDDGGDSADSSKNQSGDESSKLPNYGSTVANDGRSESSSGNNLTSHTVGMQDTVYRPAESQLPQSAQLFQQTVPIDSASTGSGESTEQLEIPDEGARWSMKTPDGQIYGPVSQAELDSWAAEGRVSAACLVQMEGNSHWQSALVLYPELSNLRNASSSNSATQAHYQNTGRYPDRGVGTDRIPGHVGAHRVRRGGIGRPSNGGTVLALAIVSLFFTFFPIFGIAAFWIARTELKGIERGEISGDRRGMLDIGYAISLLSLAISIALFFGCCVWTSGM